MTKHLCICSQCKSAELIDDRHTTASHCLITWQHMSLTPRRVDLVRDVTSVGDSVITTGARYFSECSSSSHGHHDNRLVLTTLLLYYHLVIYMSVRRVRSVGKTSQLKIAISQRNCCRVRFLLASYINATRYVTWSNRFYRATRMHSADYAVARCSSVCPSVCRSVCHTLVNGYTYPQGFLTIEWDEISPKINALKQYYVCKQELIYFCAWTAT